MSLSNNTTTPIVSARGRLLFFENGTRFFMKGIAFPVPPASTTSSHWSHDEYLYNETGWIRILRQLKVDLELDGINTVRLYRMDPTVDYSGFFREAAALGIYVLVPLTSASGHGVLDRTLPAPACYKRNLFDYGVACLHNYMQYPNTLAGVVGNEVMNSLDSWSAAPCVKAYIRDLHAYMRKHLKKDSEDRLISRSTLPLMYTAQDGGIGGAVLAATAMRLAADYLSCTLASSSDSKDHHRDDVSIDIFGINVESWCSSLGTFTTADDGSVGTYYALWKELHNTTLVLVFAEMGCPHLLFNRDNGIADKTRDWKQIPVVLNEMADTWSGFCAYAYDGSAEFNMFEGGPWNGVDPLIPTEDLFRFKKELALYQAAQNTIASVEMPILSPPQCTTVEAEMSSCCDGAFRDGKHGDLYPVDKMPSYYNEVRYQLDSRSKHLIAVALLATGVLLGIAMAILSIVRTHVDQSRSPQLAELKKAASCTVQYGSINSK